MQYADTTERATHACGVMRTLVVFASFRVWIQAHVFIIIIVKASPASGPFMALMRPQDHASPWTMRP